MTSRILTTGEQVTDSLGSPPYDQVKASGFSACSRYLRNLTRAEVESIWTAGLGVILNDELGPGDEALQGAAGGENAANRAINQALQLGWKSDSPIIYSGNDFDAVPSQFATCDEYYQTIASKGYPWGIYGGWEYLVHAETWVPKGTILWASAGWEFGMNPVPNMQQTTVQLVFGGVTVDTDTVITTLPVWTGDGINPNPPSTEVDMPLYRHDSNGVVYEIFMGYKFHCTSDYFFNVVMGDVGKPGGSGVISYQVYHDEMLNALPDWPGVNPPSVSIPTNITLNGNLHA